MKILNSSNSQEILNRVNQLSSSSQAKWGQMSPAQMLKHCKLALDVPLQNMELKPNWFIKTFWGKKIKQSMTNDVKYSEGLPTSPQFVTKDDSNIDFEEEKKNLIENIDKFTKLDDSRLEEFTHPLVGKMTAQEWRTAQWKHLDHHFNQFEI